MLCHSVKQIGTGSIFRNQKIGRRGEPAGMEEEQMEIIFQFSPCVNLAIAACIGMGSWLAIGGLLTAVERIIAR